MDPTDKTNPSNPNFSTPTPLPTPVPSDTVPTDESAPFQNPSPDQTATTDISSGGPPTPLPPSSPLPTWTPPPPGEVPTSSILGSEGNLGTMTMPETPSPFSSPATPPAPTFESTNQQSSPSWSSPSLTGQSEMPPWSAPTSLGGPATEPAGTGQGPSGSSVPPEAMPTDLSQLVSNPESSTPPSLPAPTENLIVPPTSEMNPIVTGGGSSGFPKWILAVGAVILLAVAGASAYFILGIGRPQPATTSVPAEQPPITTPPKALIPTKPPETPSSSTSSATFGGLEGSAQTAASTTSASSALELLRKRQGQ